jgi:hypothetical protein
MNKLHKTSWGSTSRIEAVEQKVQLLNNKIELLYDAISEVHAELVELKSILNADQKKPRKRRKLNAKTTSKQFDASNKHERDIMLYSIAFGTLDTKLIAAQFKVQQEAVREVFLSVIQRKDWNLLALTATNDIYWGYYFQPSKIKLPLVTKRQVVEHVNVHNIQEDLGELIIAAWTEHKSVFQSRGKKLIQEENEACNSDSANTDVMTTTNNSRNLRSKRKK